MKKTIITLVSLMCISFVFAQERIFIHKSDKNTLGASVTNTDSVYFSSDEQISFFSIGGNIHQFLVSEIDSLSFSQDTVIYINYSENSVQIVNPYAFEGVTITSDGANVTVNSTIETQDLTYRLSGSTSQGTFKLYAQKRYNLQLNNISIANPIGPAINLQSSKKCTVVLMEATVNTLTDGTTYSTAPLNSEGDSEDQSATLFSEGKLIFSGSGSLNINAVGTDKHAIAGDDEIEIINGNIKINSSEKDGIHAKDGIAISGGEINVSAKADAIDGDNGYINITGAKITTTSTIESAEAITCDSTLTISGGELNITISGNQSKGIKSAQAMTLSGGTIVINTNGGVTLEADGSGYDPSYCTAIKCDAAINISGADITIVAKGIAGKGISSDTDINISSGTVIINSSGNGATYKNSSNETKAYNSTCLSSDQNINISGGDITLSGSGTAAKGIKTEGSLTIGSSTASPKVSITTTGTKITLSGSSGGGGGMGQTGSYDETKAVKSDAAVTINSGDITISSADDGIKSTTSITVNGGNLTIAKSTEGMESPLITINKGNINITASDDSFNATKGNGGESNDGSTLAINGGNIVTNSTTGDAIDSNGNITVSGGIIVAHGPKSQPEVGLDYNGTFAMSGGFIIISGVNSNMVQGLSNSSTQYSMNIKSSQSLTNSTLFHIEDAEGKEIVTFQPMRSYSSIVFSSADLKNGSSYKIYTGGTSTGTNNNGLYSGGTYSGGTLKKTVSISSKVSSITI